MPQLQQHPAKGKRHKHSKKKYNITNYNCLSHQLSCVKLRNELLLDLLTSKCKDHATSILNYYIFTDSKYKKGHLG